MISAGKKIYIYIQYTDHVWPSRSQYFLIYRTQFSNPSSTTSFSKRSFSCLFSYLSLSRWSEPLIFFWIWLETQPFCPLRKEELPWKSRCVLRKGLTRTNPIVGMGCFRPSNPTHREGRVWIPGDCLKTVVCKLNTLMYPWLKASVKERWKVEQTHLATSWWLNQPIW